MRTSLRVLVVDDERPVLDELAYLLSGNDLVGTIHTAQSGRDALAMLHEHEIDALFLDIAMPELTGLQLARELPPGATPRIVFVTAHDDHAVDAFELNASDYLLKPVHRSRLDEAVRRVAETLETVPAHDDETIAVELGGVTRYVRRSDIVYVEAHGDYARLHVDDGSHLVRTPLSALAERWSDAGFLRIHRSLLVSASRIRALRNIDGASQVVVDVAGQPVELRVARRSVRELRRYLQGER